MVCIHAIKLTWCSTFAMYLCDLAHFRVVIQQNLVISEFKCTSNFQEYLEFHGLKFITFACLLTVCSKYEVIDFKRLQAWCTKFRCYYISLAIDY